MGTLRAFFGEHRRLAIALVAISLAMKALVPAGFMLGTQSKVLTVQICADTQGHQLTKQIVIPQSGDAGKNGGEHNKSSGACPFSSLAMGSLVGADAALLAIALVFLLALGFAPVRLPRLDRGFHLRPPLRGPPLSA